MELSSCDSLDCKATVLRIAGDSLAFLLRQLHDQNVRDQNEDAQDMLAHASSPASKLYTLVTRDVLPRTRVLLADKEQVALNALRVLAILVVEPPAAMPFPRCLYVFRPQTHTPFRYQFNGAKRYGMQFCPLVLPLLSPSNPLCSTHLFAVVRTLPPPHQKARLVNVCFRFGLSQNVQT